MMIKADFKLFLALWNAQQNQHTPAHHFKMADWLETAWHDGNTRLLLQAFRSSGKSTIVGLFAAWLLYQKPEIRILVLAADMMLARKMVRNVKRIIEHHSLTQDLRPEKADQWGADRFTIRRDQELRDPSMLAKGIISNLTGSRADYIICDDVEVPKTCDTAQKREDLREKLGEIPYVLVPGGTQLYVGTPHSWFTIYADKPRREIGEDTPFLSGYNRLTLPIYDAVSKEIIWPERYTLKDIEAIRRSAGPNKFKSQMMLEPVNIAEGHLDPAQLQPYKEELEYHAGLKALFLRGKKLVSASSWWDPAFAKQQGDKSVLAVIFTDEDGRYYLHRLFYITTQDSAEQDEATQQCRFIASKAKALYVPSVTIEINGIGRFLPNILRREMGAAKTPCAVKEISNTRPKDIRILEAFDAVMAARALYVHQSVYDTPFVTEMLEWQPGIKGGHDDGLDAVAGALSSEPIRLKTAIFAGRTSWQTGSGSHRAHTDFKV